MGRQETETGPWVIIAVSREDADPGKLRRIAPQVQDLVDEWQGRGRMVWSGAFDDGATGMAVFEGTGEEAGRFYARYSRVCSGLLRHSMYRWDAMPVLSVLSGRPAARA